MPGVRCLHGRYVAFLQKLRRRGCRAVEVEGSATNTPRALRKRKKKETGTRAAAPSLCNNNNNNNCGLKVCAALECIRGMEWHCGKRHSWAYQIESAMLERSGSRRRGIRILKSFKVKVIF